jgi:hypothetical protein
MIQRFSIPRFCSSVDRGGRRAHGAEVVAPAQRRMHRKACIGKAHSLSARFTRYRLQFFGNLCDMN